MTVNRIGEVSKTKHGSIMTILAYNNARDIKVIFNNGYIKENIYYYDFKHGKVFNPYEKNSYDIGYFGEGKYIAKDKAYQIWSDMLRRCYNEKFLKRFESYIGCSVCKEWHNYQNFAKWYDENYYIINDVQMQLDKDILYKGNKIYSSNTCVFVPYEINYILLGRNKKRGQYPIGVYLHNDKDKYVAQCHDLNKKMIYLGRYDTILEAFNIYKKYKEDVIKKVADKYRGLMPEKIYLALYNYSVEITD